MGRTIRVIAGNDLASKNVGLTFESAREVAEYGPEVKPQQSEQRDGLDTVDQFDGSLGGQRGRLGDEGHTGADTVGQDREDSQAPHKKETEVEHMMMHNVTHFMTEH